MKNKRILFIICFVICILLSVSYVNAGVFEFAEDTGEIDDNISDNMEKINEDVEEDTETSDGISVLDFMNVTPFSKDTIVTIGGIDFNIPKGFGENLNLAKDSDDDDSLNSNKSITSFSRVFFDEENMVMITVFYNDAQSAEIEDFPLDSGEVEKTIAGEKGILHKDEDFCDFTYCSDGKVIMIGADDENLISQFIV